MSILFPRSAAVALAGAMLFVGASAQAQQAPAAGGAPAQQAAPQQGGPIAANLQPVQPDWTKVCGADPATKKEICYTTRDFGAAAKEGDAPQPLLALAVACLGAGACATPPVPDRSASRRPSSPAPSPPAGAGDWLCPRRASDTVRLVQMTLPSLRR